MNYTGEKENRNFGGESIFSSENIGERTNFNGTEKDNIGQETEEAFGENVEKTPIVMPPEMDALSDKQLAVENAQEIEKKEYSSRKEFISEVTSGLKKYDDDPRELQSFWAKTANDFLDSNYNRRWGDRN